MSSDVCFGLLILLHFELGKELKCHSKWSYENAKLFYILSFLLVKSECRYVFIFQRNQTYNQIYYCIMKEKVLILIPWGIIIASFFCLSSIEFIYVLLLTHYKCFVQWKESSQLFICRIVKNTPVFVHHFSKSTTVAYKKLCCYRETECKIIKMISSSIISLV